MLYICRRSSNINHMNRKYPNGYLPKIVHHLSQGNMDKAQYFVDRHVATYGPLTDADKLTIAELYYQ